MTIFVTSTSTSTGITADTSDNIWVVLPDVFVTAASTDVIDATGSYGSKTFLIHGGLITDAADGIDMGDSTLDDGGNNFVQIYSTGSIYATSAAIESAGGELTLINDGSLSGVGTSGGILFIEDGNNTITNNGSIAAHGISSGIVISGTDNEITNTGIITTSSNYLSTAAVEFASLTGHTSTLFNTGVLSSTNTAVLGSSGDEAIHNSGTIFGDVILDAGNDSYTGLSDGLVSGHVEGGVGADTLIGGSFSDEFYGGDGEDELRGNGGNDDLSGGSAEDLLFGGNGDDILFGGSGRDTLDGGKDDDALYGESAIDTLNGGAGYDTLDGGSGDDILIGGSGRDTLYGGDDNDDLYGESAKDTLDGGGGDDTLDGGSGDDILIGGSGRDNLDGGKDDDVLYGGSAKDSLDGGRGDDTLDGGSGNDTLNGARGDDELTGGGDADVFLFELNGGNDVITDFENNNDTLELANFAFTTVAQAQGFAVQNGSDVFFDFGGEDTLTIRNITISGLTNDMDIV